MTRLTALLLGVGMMAGAQTPQDIPPPPIPPHVQHVHLDRTSKANQDSLNFHNNALESCPVGYRLEAKDWWLGVESTDNLCYKATPDGKSWHMVPDDVSPCKNGNQCLTNTLNAILALADKLPSDPTPVMKQEQPPIYALPNIVKACDREGDKNCMAVLSVTKDGYGCNEWSGFTWNPSTGRCEVVSGIQNTTHELVKCDAAKNLNANGSQTIICWYKPSPAKEGSQ